MSYISDGARIMDLHAFLAGLTTVALSILFVLIAIMGFCNVYQRLLPKGPESIEHSLVREVDAASLCPSVMEQHSEYALDLIEAGFVDWGYFSYSTWHGDVLARYFVSDDERTVCWMNRSSAPHFASLLDDGGYLETSPFDVNALSEANSEIPRPSESISASEIWARHSARLRHHCDLFSVRTETLQPYKIDRIVACGQHALLNAYMRAVSTSIPASAINRVDQTIVDARAAT